MYFEFIRAKKENLVREGFHDAFLMRAVMLYNTYLLFFDTYSMLGRRLESNSVS